MHFMRILILPLILHNYVTGLLKLIVCVNLVRLSALHQVYRSAVNVARDCVCSREVYASTKDRAEACTLSCRSDPRILRSVTSYNM